MYLPNMAIFEGASSMLGFSTRLFTLYNLSSTIFPDTIPYLDTSALGTSWTPIMLVPYSLYISIYCCKHGLVLESTISSPNNTAKGSLLMKVFAQYIACPKPFGSFRLI